ncbi:MAG: hypothetical protein QXH56_05875 [Thermoprotei archaeon]
MVAGVRSKLIVVDYPTFTLQEFDLGFNARWACFSPAGEILCVGDGGKAVLMDGTKTISLESGVTSNLRCASYSPSGELLIVGNNGLILFGTAFERLNAERSENFRRVVWSPNGDRALIVGNNGAALMFEQNTNSFITIDGAVNNLRCASWPPGQEPVVVGNAFADMFVPTPNVYRLRGERLEPVGQEAGVDLLAVDYCHSKGVFLTVGYDVVFHEPRAYILSDGMERLDWKAEAVYPSALGLHPNEEVGIVATSHPSVSKNRRCFTYIYRRQEFETLYESVGYGFVCASWSVNGDKALLLASRSARTFNV